MTTKKRTKLDYVLAKYGLSRKGTSSDGSKGSIVFTQPLKIAIDSDFMLERTIEKILGSSASSGAGLGEREVIWENKTRADLDRARKFVARIEAVGIKLTFAPYEKK